MLQRRSNHFTRIRNQNGTRVTSSNTNNASKFEKMTSNLEFYSQINEQKNYRKKICKVSKHLPRSFPKEVIGECAQPKQRNNPRDRKQGYREYTNQTEINTQGQKSDLRIVHIPEEQSKQPRLENMNEVLQGRGLQNRERGDNQYFKMMSAPLY